MNDVIISKSSPEQDALKFKALIQQSAQLKLRCILCKQKADMRGVWIPSPKYSQMLGSMPDKTRVIIYPICHRHFQTEETMQQIDDIILKQNMTSGLPDYSN